jgi:hypothetical protein
MLDSTENDHSQRDLTPDYTLPPGAFPFSDVPLSLYFDRQKLGDNPLVDIAGLAYGFAQGSLFLIFLLGRMILDALLLPIDLYKLSQK